MSHPPPEVILEFDHQSEIGNPLRYRAVRVRPNIVGAESGEDDYIIVELKWRDAMNERTWIKPTGTPEHVMTVYETLARILHDKLTGRRTRDGDDA